MTQYEWIGLVIFLVTQAFIFGGILAVTRYRVGELEKATAKTAEAVVLLASASAKAENVQREDQKILSEIDKLEKEIREGFVYFGECLGNLTQLVNTHESWLASMEKSVVGAASRPRMPAVRPTPHPPGWLPPRAHVPPTTTDVGGTGRHRAIDPRREPEGSR